MKKGNLVVSLAFGALALFIIIISVFSFKFSNDGVPGAGTWPIAISLLMLIAAITIFINALKMTPEEDVDLDLNTANSKRVYITMIGLIVYLFGMYYVGFCVATFFMLYFFISWYGTYKFYTNIITALIITGIVYSVFKYILHVPFRFGFLF